MRTIKYNIYNYQNNSSEEAYKTNSNSAGSGGSGGGGGGTIIDNTAINLLNDWFYMSNGVLHCRYPFAGDSEVSAYQAADPSTDPLQQVLGDREEYWNSSVDTYTLADMSFVSLINDTAETISTQSQARYIKKPDVLYETDGTTGLLGVNNNQLGYNWQLENYDFTPYKFLRCYIKVADFSISNNALTPSMIIELPLDSAVLAKSANDTGLGTYTPCDIYVAGAAAPNPSDLNRVFTVLVAVDSTKTKFQVVCENSLYGTAQTNRNTDGRYCYKIEGCYG